MRSLTVLISSALALSVAGTASGAENGGASRGFESHTFTDTGRKPSHTGLTHWVWTCGNSSGWSKDCVASQSVVSSNGDFETAAVTLGSSVLSRSSLFAHLDAAQP
jgi:invasion protein IalB